MSVCLGKYATFTGRASRSEYWWFVLAFLLLVWVTPPVLAALFGGSDGLLTVWTLVVLGAVIPHLAVGARRLHDTGRSGWWLLIPLIPFGIIVLLVFLAGAGTPGPNQYD